MLAVGEGAPSSSLRISMSSWHLLSTNSCLLCSSLTTCAMYLLPCVLLDPPPAPSGFICSGSSTTLLVEDTLSSWLEDALGAGLEYPLAALFPEVGKWLCLLDPLSIPRRSYGVILLLELRISIDNSLLLNSIPFVSHILSQTNLGALTKAYAFCFPLRLKYNVTLTFYRRYAVVHSLNSCMIFCFVVSDDILAPRTVVMVGSVSGGASSIGPYLILWMSSVSCCASVSLSFCPTVSLSGAASGSLCVL